MPKYDRRMASIEIEDDKHIICVSCSDVAIDGEKFCHNCKSYFEEDLPAMYEIEYANDEELG